MLKQKHSELKSLQKELKYILKKEKKHQKERTLAPELIKRYNGIAEDLNTKLSFKLDVFPEDTNSNKVTHPDTFSVLNKVNFAMGRLREQTIPYWHQTTWGYFLISLVTVVLGGVLVIWLTT